MKQLLLLSGKGGTGKTTLAGAFIKLAEAKKFADCDVDAPNLHLVAEITRTQTPAISDFYGMPKAYIDKKLCAACGLCIDHCRFDAISENFVADPLSCEGCGLCYELCPSKAISMNPHISGLLQLYSDQNQVFSTACLHMGSGNSGLLVTEVKRQLNSHALSSKLAIIDGSPGIGCPVIASLTGVDRVLIVAEPSVSGISDMNRVIRTASGLGVEISVCINKYDVHPEKTKDIEEYCKRGNYHFAGKVPYDSQAVTAINQGESIIDVPSAAEKAVRKVFTSVITELFQEGESVL